MWSKGQVIFCGEPFKVSHHITNFGGNRQSKSKDIFLVFHMILLDQMIKGPHDFISASLSW